MGLPASASKLPNSTHEPHCTEMHINHTINSIDVSVFVVIWLSLTSTNRESETSGLVYHTTKIYRDHFVLAAPCTQSTNTISNYIVQVGFGEDKKEGK